MKVLALKFIADAQEGEVVSADQKAREAFLSEELTQWMSAEEVAPAEANSAPVA